MSALHFLHISDSHVRSGNDAAQDLEMLRERVALINRMVAENVPLDFVVHTGDLVNDADACESTDTTTQQALAELDKLPVVWFLLNGNHDRRVFLQPGPRANGWGEVPVTDAHGLAAREIDGIQLLFVDINPESGEHEDLEGVVSIETTREVARAIDTHAGRTVVFMHYPPLAQEATWTAPPAGGDALHECFSARTDKVVGVFLGHNHRGIIHLCDGVTYATAPALADAFLLWPGQAMIARDPEPVSGMHYVTLERDGGLRIQHHAFVSARTTA